ncbi:hypothetical protein KEM56_006562 [Ascosphaera pollenicola]|nr:hypothetical protein KEM56_006562 [Ascosphaera pollenicola]
MLTAGSRVSMLELANVDCEPLAKNDDNECENLDDDGDVMRLLLPERIIFIKKDIEPEPEGLDPADDTGLLAELDPKESERLGRTMARGVRKVGMGLFFTEDDDMVARVESILAPRDPSILDENDWEEFTLSDVQVYHADRKRYACILSASEDRPLVAIGKLKVLKEQRSLVIDKKYAASYVIVNDITHFAFGQDENGDIAIWVAGPPGWFSITPNQQYKMIFDASVEAVELFYFVVDHCRTAKRRKKGAPNVDKLCAEWNKRIGNTFPTTADVADTFHKHHEFLMKQMNEGAEGVKWHKTPIYAYLSEHHPELARPIESFKKSTVKTKRAPVIKIKHSSLSSEEFQRGRPLSSPFQAEGDIESGTQTPSERNARGKVQKSILRPRTASKNSGKGTGDALVTEKGVKKRLAINIANANGEEDDSISEASETPSRTSSSNAAIDALLDNLSSLPVRPKKKSRLGMMSTATNDTSTASDVNKDTSSSDNEQPLSAELPPDTWVCPVENCPKIVYKASQRYSKDVISDHSLSHAHDAKGMLDLVFSEQRRNVNANVSHLVGRIREFAQVNTETNTEGEAEPVTAELAPANVEMKNEATSEDSSQQAVDTNLEHMPTNPHQGDIGLITPIKEGKTIEGTAPESAQREAPDAKISPAKESCVL